MDPGESSQQSREQRSLMGGHQSSGSPRSSGSCVAEARGLAPSVHTRWCLESKADQDSTHEVAAPSTVR